MLLDLLANSLLIPAIRMNSSDQYDCIAEIQEWYLLEVLRRRRTMGYRQRNERGGIKREKKSKPNEKPMQL